MDGWSAHQLFSKASEKHGVVKAREIRNYASNLKRLNLPVIFSLHHLSKIVNIDHTILQSTVNRKRESANYRMFSISKRDGGKRYIHSVSLPLLTTQNFLNKEILQSAVPHRASYAYHASGGIQKCAAQHCGAKWIFKFDIENFFYNITEADVFKIFLDFGYTPLLAFELARICTTTRLPYGYVGISRKIQNRKYSLYPQIKGALGVLPQGAPTSPMLSNLVARSLDEALTDLAIEHGFVYTRYADDLTFSSTTLPQGLSIRKFCKLVISKIHMNGFRHNSEKTKVIGPGAKKIVLGMLVDGEKPRISRETYKRVDRHLHASQKYGFKATAEHELFDSAYGFYNHLSGLISFVQDVDPARGEEFRQTFKKINIPWK